MKCSRKKDGYQLLKKLLAKIILRKAFAPLLVRPVLMLHNLTYLLAGRLGGLASENGLHPKHGIIRYKEWFCEHIRPDDIVLDIGSNTGELPRLIARHATQVFGIEINPELHQAAIRHANPENLKFFLGDATAFDLSRLKNISKITLSNVLEHIEKRPQFLTKILNNIVWRGGPGSRVLLIRVPLFDRDWITTYKYQSGVEWRLDRTHFTEYTLESLSEELAQAGLEIAEYKIKYGEIYAVCMFKTQSTEG